MTTATQQVVPRDTDSGSALQAMHAFRDNVATFLLATPAAARGLDLPAVSHIYNLGCPEDTTEYLHRAGRAGRIGSPVRGDDSPEKFAQ